VDEEESEEAEGGEEDEEEEEDEDVAGHSSLSVPVRGPGPKQYIRPSLLNEQPPGHSGSSAKNV